VTSRDRFLAVLHGETPDRVPYIEAGIDFPFICRLLQQAVPEGRYFDSGEYETTPLAFQLELNRLLHRDNLTYHQAPPIPAHKLPGQDQILFFHDGELKTWAEVDKLRFPDVSGEAVRGPVREFVARAREHGYATVLSTRVGMSATYLGMGMEHFYVTLKDDPALVGEILRRYTDWSCQVVRMAKETGCDVVWTSDDIAGKIGPLWSPAMFREVFWPHVRKFATAVRDAGIPWMYHSDGDLWKVLPDLVGFGITGLNPIEPGCMEIREVRERYPHLVLSGNVDVDLLSRGTPAEVRGTVRTLIRDLGPGGRYVVSSGNSVASYCSTDNVLAMGDAIQEFGRYPIAA